MGKPKKQRNIERSGISGYIQCNPGCGIGQIANEVGLSEISVGLYVYSLDKKGYLKAERKGREWTIYPK